MLAISGIALFLIGFVEIVLGIDCKKNWRWDKLIVNVNDKMEKYIELMSNQFSDDSDEFYPNQKNLLALFICFIN